MSPVQEAAPQHIPQRVEEQLQASSIVLPDRANINIKLAKQHPVADVISAFSHLVLFVASSAITFMFAMHQIKSGPSGFGPIQVALDAMERLNRK